MKNNHRHYYYKIKNGKYINSEHRIIAERALGRELPPGVQVHHHNGYDRDTTVLVICENNQYHKLLHARENALKACGNPLWRKCSYCGEYDSPENLYMSKRNTNHVNHRKCKAKHESNRKIKNGFVKRTKEESRMYRSELMKNMWSKRKEGSL